MMDCTSVQQRLSDYLDDRLEPIERRSIAAHIERCSACRADLHDLRKTVDLLGDLPYMQAPPDLAQRVFSATTDKGRQRRDVFSTPGRFQSMLPLLRGAAAAAVILLFAVVGLQVIQKDYKGPDSEKTPPPVKTAVENDLGRARDERLALEKETPKRVVESLKDVDDERLDKTAGRLGRLAEDRKPSLDNPPKKDTWGRPAEGGDGGEKKPEHKEMKRESDALPSQTADDPGAAPESKKADGGQRHADKKGRRGFLPPGAPTPAGRGPAESEKQDVENGRLPARSGAARPSGNPASEGMGGGGAPRDGGSGAGKYGDVEDRLRERTRRALQGEARSEKSAKSKGRHVPVVLIVSSSDVERDRAKVSRAFESLRAKAKSPSALRGGRRQIKPNDDPEFRDGQDAPPRDARPDGPASAGAPGGAPPAPEEHAPQARKHEERGGSAEAAGKAVKPGATGYAGSAQNGEKQQGKRREEVGAAVKTMTLRMTLAEYRAFKRKLASPLRWREEPTNHYLAELRKHLQSLAEKRLEELERVTAENRDDSEGGAKGAPEASVSTPEPVYIEVVVRFVETPSPEPAAEPQPGLGEKRPSEDERK